MFRPTLIWKDSTKKTVKRHSLQKIEEKSKSRARDISPQKKSQDQFDFIIQIFEKFFLLKIVKKYFTI